MKRTILALAVASAALMLAPSAPAPRAQTSSGGLTLSLGYDGRLIFKVLDIEVEERATPQGFESHARLISTGILAVVKHIDEVTSSRGRFVGGEPRPGAFEYQHLTGKTHRRVRTQWTNGEVTSTATPPFASMGDPPASLDQKLSAADPLTALMRLTLNGSRERICRQTSLFFDGKQFYALDFSNPTDVPPTIWESALGLVNHFRCEVRYRQLAGFGRPGKRKSDPLRPMDVDFAQVGQGGPWVISRLQSPTPLGPATVELRRLTVSGRSAGG